MEELLQLQTEQTMSSREIAELKLIDMFGGDIGGAFIEGCAKMRDGKLKQKTYLATDGNLYKIGRAADPSARIKSLLIANPKLALIHTIGRDIEGYLHKKYRSKMVSREWFDLSKQDVEQIKSMI